MDEMTARDAYRVLILGQLLEGKYGEGFKEIRRRVLWGDANDLLADGVLSRADYHKLAAAYAYREAIRQVRYDGWSCFQSIYDLLLFYEGVRYILPPPVPIAYRGHRDGRWPLVPTLLRSDDVSAPAKTIWAAEQVWSQYPQYRDVYKLLAIAQHYGFPTQLLDFTASLRIAAAFACGVTNSESRGVGPTYGAIYSLSRTDYDELVPLPPSAFGKLVSVEADDVPRIRIQKGIFFSSNKPGTLEALTRFTTSRFLHGEDSRTFADTTGLSASVLFPPDDQLERLLAPGRAKPSPLYGSREQTIADVHAALQDARDQMTKSVELDDIRQLASLWRTAEDLPEHARREIDILCRWYHKLWNASLPGWLNMARSVRKFKWGIETICAIPSTRAEESTDFEAAIYGISNIIGQREYEYVLALSRQFFEEARAEAE